MSHPGGRPTKYNSEFHPKLAAALAALGRTDKEIAYELEISEATLYNWKNEHSEFLEALKTNKQTVDNMVENALLKRALGYTHEEDKIFQYEGKAVVVPTTKHYPPDTAAAFIWLKNRRSQEWRDKKDIEHSGELTIKDAQAIAESIIGKDDEPPEVNE